MIEADADGSSVLVRELQECQQTTPKQQVYTLTL
jgi:hypothetical protein